RHHIRLHRRIHKPVGNVSLPTSRDVHHHHVHRRSLRHSRRGHARHRCDDLVCAYAHHCRRHTVHANLVSLTEPFTGNRDLPTGDVHGRRLHARRIKDPRLVCEVRPSASILISHNKRIVPRA